MSFHEYKVNEVYSNADGTVQFIEMAVGTATDNESFWSGQTITVTHGTSHSFQFPHNLTNGTSNHKALIATQSFADLGLVTPDFIVPDGFLFTSGGSINYANVDIYAYPALPTDGAASIDRATGTQQAASPTNNLDATTSYVLHIGSATNDTVTGGSGKDFLFGGAGTDTLTGGTNSDKFDFGAAALTDASATTPIFDDVKDFDRSGAGGLYSAAEGDQVDVSAITGSAFTGGQLATALVRFVDDPSNANVLLQVDSNGTTGGIAWKTLAQLDGLHGADTVNTVVSTSFLSGIDFSVLTNAGHFGDFDGDGNDDLLWRNDNGLVATWKMSGNTIQSGNFFPTVTNDWHILGVGDFDGDHKSDILWLNDNGSMIYWQMNSSSAFGSTPTLPNAPTNSYLAGIGDTDNDGKSDLFWRDSTTGVVTVKTMAGTSLTITGVGNDWSVIGVGDYNGDGIADVMFRNASQGVNAAWLMNGTTTPTTMFYPGVPNDWHVEATGDFDGNGTSDLFWHNDNGGSAAWFMDTSGNVQKAAFYNGVGSDWHVIGAANLLGSGDEVIWRNDAGATAEWSILQNGGASVAFPGGVPTDWATQAHHYDFV